MGYFNFVTTFMRFVKHKGKIPVKFAKKPAIAKKWEAVVEICRRGRRRADESACLLCKTPVFQTSGSM